ncbi:PucR family transcriptional regulator ligand-binding domain-containing protein [Streptomyces sp. NPDC088760]|uniref:PucR family transcriptional regulator ligand-binding domain-containing protein n=1 Tax=Streptomyces sp. NPDC088760 TaxID=3365890 RepID=UPI00382BB864
MPETIAPAVPPTPPVPLQALLAREDLALRQIAGPADPGIVIHWAHTSEMADPYPYLLGGELLLTAGVHIPEAAGSGTYFEDYVSRIVAAGGAALGFGLAPVHDTVPRALVVACERYGLPLLEVPPQTTFSGVARAVWQLMAQARLAELRRVTEAQQSLAAAASRPDPVPSVLRQLAQRLGGRAVLYGPDGTEVAGAGRETPEAVRTALAELAGVVRPTTAAAADTGRPPATPVSPSAPGPVPTPSGPATRPRPASPAQASPAPPAPTAPATRPHPASAPGPSTAPAGPPTRPRPASHASPAATRAHPTSATDTHGSTHLAVYALGAGAGFVLGVAAPRRDPGDHTIASVAAVLLSLLTGEHQSGAGAARSSALVRLLLGAPPEQVAPLLGTGQWLVVHARPEAQAPDAVAASALGAALGSPLVDLAGDVVRVLVPADREPEPQPGWTLGVSAAAGPPEWPAADTQAARALARARATRTPLVRHAARPALEDLVPRADADTHARTLLAPLAGQAALAETLRTWLSLHGSWDRTAVALDVHRNTVRQRIARCAALLAADLDDPDVRMELWFALRRT